MARRDTADLGSLLEFYQHDFGGVATPYEIIGNAGGAQWNFLDEQKSFILQNISGDWVEISHDENATDGFRIPHNAGLRIDFSDSWNGSIYAVNSAAGVTNVIMAVCLME